MRAVANGGDDRMIALLLMLELAKRRLAGPIRVHTALVVCEFMALHTYTVRLGVVRVLCGGHICSFHFDLL